jgi:hypothetical protein
MGYDRYVKDLLDTSNEEDKISLDNRELTQPGPGLEENVLSSSMTTE